MLNEILKQRSRDERKRMTDSLPCRLLRIIESNIDFLLAENKKATFDVVDAIIHDFEYTINYLKEYKKNNSDVFKKKLKPKGKILLMLSYNEPTILSVVPLLNALIAGNSVSVKPSKRCINFFNKIWIESGIINDLNLPLDVVEINDWAKTIEIISQMQAVYFFGSYKNAKTISKICAECFVEFIPEIETADCKIFNVGSIESLEEECRLTLMQSFTHAGQTCQRICGIFVPESLYPKYRDALIAVYWHIAENNIINLISPDFKSNDEYSAIINSHIRAANSSEVIQDKNSLEKIVLNPNPSSDFVKNGYFYPVLWVIPYKDERELIIYLNQRKFFLGLNIISNDVSFIDRVIDATKFTRYTVNMEHVNIGTSEGWGGRWPSGAGGYKSWIEHFSVPYTVIVKKNEKENGF